MERSLGDHEAGDLVLDSGPQLLTQPRHEYLRYSLFAFYSFAIVFLLRESVMTGHDPGNFLAAIELGLDATRERPHVPGYPLFVLLWQGLATLGFEAQNAILFANAMWMTIGLSALHKLAIRFANARVSMIAVAFAAFNPLILFYGATGEMYLYDLAFSSVTILAVSSVKREHLKWVWLAFGIAGGFRLSSIVFMYPALLTATMLRKEDVRALALYHAVGAIGILLWLVPFTMHHGGIDALSKIFSSTVSLPSTILQSGATYLSAAIWMLHLALPLLVFVPKRVNALTSDKKIILLVWLLVPTLFFVFKFYAKGYAIITLPVFAIALAMVIDSFRKPMIVTCAVVAAGIACFFVVPFSPPSIALDTSETISDRIETAGLRTLSWFATSNSHLRAREAMMLEALSLIEKHVPVGDTIAIEGSTQLWAHGRTLQYHVPDRHLLILHHRGPAMLYALEAEHGLELSDAFPASTLFLCPTEVARVTPEISAMQPIERGDFLVIYRAPAKAVIDMIKRSAK